MNGTLSSENFKGRNNVGDLGVQRKIEFKRISRNLAVGRTPHLAQDGTRGSFLYTQ
jgi:hypothetical protein